MPYDSTEPPPSEENAGLVGDCRRRGRGLIIGCDANSHHAVWGSTNINARDEALLEYLVRTGLQITNRGREASFRITNRVAVIDLTLGTPDMAERIKKWRETDEPSQSDHMDITFTLYATTVRMERGRIRNPGETDWPSYVEALHGSSRVGMVARTGAISR